MMMRGINRMREDGDMVNECWGCRYFIRYGKRTDNGECHRYAPHAAMVKSDYANRQVPTK